MSSNMRLWAVRVVLTAVFAASLLFPAGVRAAGHFKTLHRFRIRKRDGGMAPIAGLVFDQEGNLYGATSVGGAQGGGTVFELTPKSGVWIFTVLHAFGGADGANPFGTLIFDQAGSLYGTTSFGGA